MKIFFQCYKILCGHLEIQCTCKYLFSAAVDALEIDWASMVKDERPRLVTGAALKRFKPGALFAQMGISRQYAGEELYKEVQDVCQKHQEEELGMICILREIENMFYDLVSVG